MKIQTRKSSNSYIFTLLIVGLLLTIVFAFLAGRYPLNIGEFFAVLFAKITGNPHGLDANFDTIIFTIRLPRILAAIIVGAALSVAGAAYQGIFKNPLVSPDILGASAGAGFGATLAIILSLNSLGIQLLAFAFGLLAVGVTYLIGARFVRTNISLILILAGILVGTLFSSFISLLKYVADPYEKLPAITFWLMGGLTRIELSDLYIVLVPVVVGLVPLFMLRWRLNVMAFGDEEAQTLGVNTKSLRLLTIVSATLVTAAVVSISGIIGWVGLLVPHLARFLVGPDYRLLIPASLLIGSIYLLLVDTLARAILPIEIPLGIFTAIIGAPLFIYLLAYARKGWL